MTPTLDVPKQLHDVEVKLGDTAPTDDVDSAPSHQRHSARRPSEQRARRDRCERPTCVPDCLDLRALSAWTGCPAMWAERGVGCPRRPIAGSSTVGLALVGAGDSGVVRGMDVVIVGGGIGGLTAALGLGRRGHRVRVLERDPAPAPVDPEEAFGSWPRRGVPQWELYSRVPGEGSPGARPTCS